LKEHPRWLQVVLALVLPAAYGALTGYFLGVSEVTYLVLATLGILGGIGAGFDHMGAAIGLRRGIVAGLIFGCSILIAHEIHGADAKADLPDPETVLIAVTTGLGAAFGALGGWLRQRVDRRQTAAAGAREPGLGHLD